MTQRRGPNIAASIHQRLLNKARETGRPFNEVLQYFDMERFLYRLSKSDHGQVHPQGRVDAWCVAGTGHTSHYGH